MVLFERRYKALREAFCPSVLSRKVAQNIVVADRVAYQGLPETDTMVTAWQPPFNYRSRPVAVLGAGVLGRRIGMHH